MNKYFLLFLMPFYMINMTGCATNADSNAMVYISSDSQKSRNSYLHQNIAISEVNGGQASMLSSKINNLEFKKALESSLMVAGLETDRRKATYLLDVNIIKLDQPLFGGFNLTVNFLVNYKLIDKNNKMIYTKNISSTYTAKFSETFSAEERLRFANEGAARENIREVINDLLTIKH